MEAIEELEELLYNLNKTPEQPPWYLVNENDGAANHWRYVAEQIIKEGWVLKS